MTAMNKSPFPGMDPYLERHWLDVHQSLVTYARDALNALLPGDLIARTEERVVIDAEPGHARIVHPDVRVQETPGGPIEFGGTTAGASAVAEPIVLELESEPRPEGYVTILDATTGDRLVTVIEFLSATNKLPGENRDAFRRKRSEMVGGGVNWVEIDLIRTGSWRELLQPHVAPPWAESAYRAVVRRGNHPGRAELYPLPLRQRLIELPIPLRQGDPDVRIDLQSLVDQAYRNGRYGSMQYAQACEPTLAAEDAEWAASLLRSARG
jgi:uncharacterized protein DUF4058